MNMEHKDELETYNNHIKSILYNKREDSQGE